MSDYIALASREALFLAIITAIGVGPAAFLPPSFSRSARIAFAPVLGLSVAVCLFTTIEWYLDADQAQWLVIPIAVMSLAIGVSRYRNASRKRQVTPIDAEGSQRQRRTWRPIFQMFLVCIVVSLPSAEMLASQHSVGPTAYDVYDSPGYVADADGAQVISIGDADHTSPPVANLVLEHWVNQVQTNNRLDITPIAAAVNALVGLHGTETWAAYLLALFAATALALYGAICVASQTQSWFAVVGSALIGGAFFLQLLMDGSQAAIAGLSLIVPLLLLIRENAHRPAITTMVLTALLLGGLTTVYPVFFLPLAATAIVYLLLSIGMRSSRHWTVIGVRLLRGLSYTIGIFFLSSIFDVIAASRNIPAWVSILAGSGGSASQPQYHLGFGVIASWLLQVRDFYTTAFGPQSPFFDLLPTLIIPVIAICLLLIGLRRVRAVWIPLIFVAICAISATKQVAVDSCAYCEDRTLLPVVPVVLFILFTTLSVVLNKKSSRHAILGAIGTAIYLSFVGLSINSEQNRFATSGGYFLSDTVRDAIHSLPATTRPLQMEGFDSPSFPSVLAEETLPYETALESVPSGVSFFPDEPGQGITTAFGPAKDVKGNTFASNYQYVLTRNPQIETGRNVLYDNGGVALEERAMPLEVTLKGGLSAPIDPSQSGNVAGTVDAPLTFVVTGKTSSKEILRLAFLLPSAAMQIPRNPPVHLQKNGVYVHLCIPINATATATAVAVSTIPINEGIVLRSMTAAYGSCR